MPNSATLLHHVEDIPCSPRQEYSPEIRLQLDEASALINAGKFDKAEQKLRLLVETGNAEAQYLFAGFSVHGETEKQFEHRCLGLLEASAAQSYPSSIYEIAVAFDIGGLVEQDKLQAAKLFEEAAQLGHIKAQWIHGTALLYGANGVKQDITLGLEMIRTSANRKFKGALITLAHLHETGEFGFEVSEEMSIRLKQEAESEDVVDY